MTTYNIRNKDQQTTPQKFMLKERIKAVAILDNLRSAYNTGSIFRTADTVRLGKLFLCGSTPTPLNPKLVKTSLGAEEFVPWEYFTKTEDFKIVLNKDCISFVASYEKVAYRNTWDGRIHYDDFISFNKSNLSLIKEDVMWYK